MPPLRSLVLLGWLTVVPAAHAEREGSDLIGTPAPGWGESLVWVGSEPLHLRDLRGSVVLVRWWTDTCPYCSRSAPALNEFHARFAEKGLVVVGMFHPKPIARPATVESVAEAAEERGFRFPVAIDRDWSLLRRYWLGRGRHRATSVSFLIDRSGVIRYVHPGPAFHREVLGRNDGPLRDFLELEGMIRKLLDERGAVEP
jgi:peroxiredoxin